MYTVITILLSLERMLNFNSEANCSLCKACSLTLGPGFCCHKRARWNLNVAPRYKQIPQAFTNSSFYHLRRLQAFRRSVPFSTFTSLFSSAQALITATRYLLVLRNLAFHIFNWC